MVVSLFLPAGNLMEQHLPQALLHDYTLSPVFSPDDPTSDTSVTRIENLVKDGNWNLTGATGKNLQTSFFF